MVIPLLTEPQTALMCPTVCECSPAPSLRSPIGRSPEGLRSMMGRFLRRPTESASESREPATETILAAGSVGATHSSGLRLEDAGPTGRPAVSTTRQ